MRKDQESKYITRQWANWQQSQTETLISYCWKYCYSSDTASVFHTMESRRMPFYSIW